MLERVNPERTRVRPSGVPTAAGVLAPPIDLEHFVRTDYPRVVAAVGLMTGDREHAEDAVQDALARLLADPPTEPLRSVAAWVTVAARNGAHSRRRRVGAEQRALTRLSSRAEHRHVTAEASEATVGQHDDLMAAIGGLADQQRQMCVMHYYLDLAVADIAAALGVSAGTVKTQLHRARRTLAASLGPTATDDDTGAAPRSDTHGSDTSQPHATNEGDRADG